MDEVKVLIIDDDELIAQSTTEYFNMFDVKSEYVTDYDSAVNYLENHIVSLLLLDINLGDKSGFDLCKKVRENYDMPILFISARTSDDDVLIALNIGGDDYIKKPFTLNILLAKVKAILLRYEKAKAALANDNESATITKDESKSTTKIKLTEDFYQ
jgi:two-component system response regulator RegX3